MLERAVALLFQVMVVLVRPEEPVVVGQFKVLRLEFRWTTRVTSRLTVSSFRTLPGAGLREGWLRISHLPTERLTIPGPQAAPETRISGSIRVPTRRL